MDKKELFKERKNIISTYKKEKDTLYKNFKSKLDEIDKKIKGQKTNFANKQAKTVKQVLGEVKRGGRVKDNTYKWNKTQTQSLKKNKQS